MTTTRKDVFAAAEAEILKREGAKARGAFRNHLDCLAPEDLEKIDEMCTNNSLASMVSWLKSHRSIWFIRWSDSQKRFFTVTSGDIRYFFS